MILCSATQARGISALFSFCHSCLFSVTAVWSLLFQLVCYEEVCLLLLMLLLLQTSGKASDPACIMQENA